MGDWNTLHLFDHNRYLKKVVPGVKDGSLIRKYLKDDRLLRRTYGFPDLETLISSVQKELVQLDPELRYNVELHHILTKPMTGNSNRQIYLNRKAESEVVLNDESKAVLENYTNIITYIIFAECAVFSPHLNIGRSIFSHCVNMEEGSLLEELHNKWRYPKPGHVISMHGAGILGWLSTQEVSLLELELKNGKPATAMDWTYYEDFTWMVKTAVARKWGLTGVTNISEGLIANIDSPKLKIANEIPHLTGSRGLIAYKR